MGKKLVLLKPGTEEWRKVMHASVSSRFEVTQRSRDLTLNRPHRNRGGVRIAMGRFDTDAEREAFRRKVLGTSKS